jgi:hypothetical protein
VRDAVREKVWRLFVKIVPNRCARQRLVKVNRR